MKNPFLLISTTILILASQASLAYKAGDVIVRSGFAVADAESSGSTVFAKGANAGVGVNVEDDTNLGITGVYMVTDHIGVELLASLPFHHDISVNDGTNNYNIGTTKHLPPTLSLQYYPMSAESRFQPYAGVGVNWTVFFDDKVNKTFTDELGFGESDLDLEDSWGVAAQIGIDYKLTDNFIFNTAVWYLDVDTDATIRTELGTLKADLEIDPWVYMVGIGYVF